MLARLVSRKGEPQPEFVSAAWVAKFIRRDADYVKKIKLLEEVPFKIDGSGHKIYKLDVVKNRVYKYKLTPPVTDHPLFEMSQEEALLYLGIANPTMYMNHVRKGDITVHVGSDGRKKVYRKDADRFLRTFDRNYLLQYIREPLLMYDAAQILGVNRNYMAQLIRKHQIFPEPRKKREYRRISQTSIIKFVTDHQGGRKFRKHPIPDYMSRAVAEIYCSPIPDARNALRARLIVAEQYVGANGKRKWGISKAKLDDLIDKCWAGRCYGTPTKKYYTARNIECKFGKSKAWIDQFIRGKCTRVNRYGVASKTGFNCGWAKEEVEAIVNSGVDYCPEIKLPSQVHRNEPKRYVAPKPREYEMLPVRDAIEAALDNAYSEREFQKEQQARETMRRRKQMIAEREAIRVELGYEPVRPPSVRRENLLRNSQVREIISLVYNHQACSIYKDKSLSRFDLAVFSYDRKFKLRRKAAHNSVTRLIHYGISRQITPHVQLLPEWIVIVPATSYIPDINFHDILRSVPPEVMAVAPYGYGYRTEDGRWGKCMKTYGLYQQYSLTPVRSEYVVGTCGVGGMNPVEVLGGPFVAIRGEMLDKMSEIHYFNVLGECRWAVPFIISGICHRYHLGMMQIPVLSSCCADFCIKPGTARWIEVENRIIQYECASVQEISTNRKKESF